MWVRLRIGYPILLAHHFPKWCRNLVRLHTILKVYIHVEITTLKYQPCVPIQKKQTKQMFSTIRRKPLGNATELLGQFLQAFSQRCCTQAWLVMPVMPVMPWKPGQPGGFPKSWSYPSWDGLRWLMAMSGTDWLKVPTINKRPIFQASISGNIPAKYGQKYGTFTYLHDLGSWRSPIELRTHAIHTNRHLGRKTKPGRFRGFDYLRESTRPGKHTKNDGKSPFLMGKLTISMAMFNGKLLVYQRVHSFFSGENHHKMEK